MRVGDSVLVEERGSLCTNVGIFWNLFRTRRATLRARLAAGQGPLPILFWK